MGTHEGCGRPNIISPPILSTAELSDSGVLIYVDFAFFSDYHVVVCGDGVLSLFSLTVLVSKDFRCVHLDDLHKIGLNFYIFTLAY